MGVTTSTARDTSTFVFASVNLTCAAPASIGTKVARPAAGAKNCGISGGRIQRADTAGALENAAPRGEGAAVAEGAWLAAAVLAGTAGAPNSARRGSMSVLISVRVSGPRRYD